MVSMCVELLPRRCCRWREEENVMRILHLPLVVFVDTQPPEERVAHNPRVCVRRRPLCVLQLALQWRHTPRGGVRRIQTTCRRGRRGRRLHRWADARVGTSPSGCYLGRLKGYVVDRGSMRISLDAHLSPGYRRRTDRALPRARRTGSPSGHQCARGTAPRPVRRWRSAGSPPAWDAASGGEHRPRTRGWAALPAPAPAPAAAHSPGHATLGRPLTKTPAEANSQR